MTRTCMTTLTLQIPEDVYKRVEQHAAAHGATVSQEIVHLLEGIHAEHNETQLDTARTRMTELFRTIKGFRQASRIPREELYERGSLR